MPVDSFYISPYFPKNSKFSPISSGEKKEEEPSKAPDANNPTPAAGAIAASIIFFPLIIPGLILSGCAATQKPEEKSAEETLEDLKEIAVQIEILKDPASDRESRRRAIHALALTGKPAVQFVIELLGDEWTQDFAVEILLLMRETAVPGLLKKLESSDLFFQEETKGAIAGILAGIGRPAIPYLIDELRKGNSNTEGRAASLLAAIGEDSAAALAKELKNEDFETQWRIIQILRWIKSKNKETVAALTELIKDEKNDAGLRLYAAITLSEITKVWTYTYPRKSANAQETVMEALKQISAHGLNLPKLVKFLMDENGSPEVQQTLISIILALEEIEDPKELARALKKIQKTIIIYIPSLAEKELERVKEKLKQNPFNLTARVKMLGEAESEKAIDEIIAAIVKMGPAVIPDLIEEFKNEDFITAMRSAKALSRMGRPAIYPLREAALEGSDWLARQYAIEALLMTEAKESVVASLNGRLNDKKNEVRARAARILGMLQSELAISALTRKLADENKEVRETVVVALGKIGDKAAIPALLERAIKEEDPKIRKCVIEALKNLETDESHLSALIGVWENGDEEAQAYAKQALDNLAKRKLASLDTSVLIECLKGQNLRVRKWAAVILTKKGRTAAPYLIKLLEDKDPAVRIRTIEILIRAGDQTAKPALLKRLTEEKNGRVLKFIIKALANPGMDKSDIPALLGLLENEAREVRKFAIEELGKPGMEPGREDIPRLIMLLIMENPITGRPDIRSFAFEELKRPGMEPDESHIPFLLEALKEGGWDVRKYAKELMEKLGPEKLQPYLPRLVELLTEDDKNVKKFAAETLGKMKDESSAAPLITALGDKDIRKEAISALEKTAIKKPEKKLIIKTAFIRELKNECGLPGVKDGWLIVPALERMGLENSDIPLLLEALKESGPDARDYIVEALGKLAVNETHIPFLLDLLTLKEAGKKYDVPYYAMEALHKLTFNETHIPLLLETAKNGEWPGCEYVLPVLEKMAAPVDQSTYISILLKKIEKGLPHQQEAALSTLKKMKPDYPILLVMLKSSYAGARFYAAGALGGKGGEPAIPELKAVITNKNENRGVRRCAIRSLGKIKAPSALPVLFEALEDPGLDIDAIADALKEADFKSAISGLAKMIKDKNQPEIVRWRSRKILKNWSNQPGN